MSDDDLSAQIAKVVQDEKSLATRLKSLKDDYPEVFDELDAISKADKEVACRKTAIKSELVKRKDFDIHEENPSVRVSVSRITRVVAPDIEKVPTEYLKVETVADEKKATEYLRVMGEPPEGFVDKSIYRLNWKIKKPIGGNNDEN